MSSEDYMDKNFEEIINDKDVDFETKKKRVIKLFTYLKGMTTENSSFAATLFLGRQVVVNFLAKYVNCFVGLNVSIKMHDYLQLMTCYFQVTFTLW